MPGAGSSTSRRSMAWCAHRAKFAYGVGKACAGLHHAPGRRRLRRRPHHLQRRRAGPHSHREARWTATERTQLNTPTCARRCPASAVRATSPHSALFLASDEATYITRPQSDGRRRLDGLLTAPEPGNRAPFLVDIKRGNRRARELRPRSHRLCRSTPRPPMAGRKTARPQFRDQLRGGLRAVRAGWRWRLRAGADRDCRVRLRLERARPRRREHVRIRQPGRVRALDAPVPRARAAGHDLRLCARPGAQPARGGADPQ